MTPEDINGLAKSVEVAKDYADAIVLPPLQQLGGILSDTVGYWRLKNRVNFLLKIKRYLEEQGVKPTKLLPDVFVPLLDEAGNTEDETLSEMFARLGATHLDAEQAGKAHPSFAKTLGQLSPLDVRILRLIDAKDERNYEGIFERVRLKGKWEPDATLSRFQITDEARSMWKVTADQAHLSLMNLERLGLVAERETMQVTVAGTKVRDIHVSNYAMRLQSACSKPGTYWGQTLEGINEWMHDKTKANAEQFHRDLANGVYDDDEEDSDEAAAPPTKGRKRTKKKNTPSAGKRR